VTEPLVALAGKACDDDATGYGHDDHRAHPIQLLWCSDVSRAVMASNMRFAARGRLPDQRCGIWLVLVSWGSALGAYTGATIGILATPEPAVQPEAH
jgi:hypothetical protein